VILGVASAAATPKRVAAILRPPAVATAATRRYVAHGDAGLDDWPNLDDLRRGPDRHGPPRSDFLTWSSRASREVISNDQQLLRIRHAELATGLTEVLGVVLVEQLTAVGIRRLERAHERRLNR
jgi:hypothetical protein